MTASKNQYIRFEWAIKRLLCSKANFGVLEGFLTVFLNEPITIVEILESKSNQLSPEDEFYRVYIKARNSQREIVIIEVRNTRELYYFERILYGAITEHIQLDNSYSEAKKAYSINILYSNLGIGSDYLYHGQNQFIGVHTGDQLIINAKERNAIASQLPSEISPEYILIRLNKFDKVAVTAQDEWMRYLKDGIIAPDTKAPGLDEARKKLQYFSMSDSERHAYDEHINAIMIQNDVLNTAKLEGRAEGREEGLREGRAERVREGRQEERLKNARALKAFGMSIEDISKVLNLEPDDIARL